MTEIYILGLKGLEGDIDWGLGVYKERNRILGIRVLNREMERGRERLVVYRDRYGGFVF